MAAFVFVPAGVIRAPDPSLPHRMPDAPNIRHVVHVLDGLAVLQRMSATDRHRAIQVRSRVAAIERATSIAVDLERRGGVPLWEEVVLSIVTCAHAKLELSFCRQPHAAPSRQTPTLIPRDIQDGASRLRRVLIESVPRLFVGGSNNANSARVTCVAFNQNGVSRTSCRGSSLELSSPWPLRVRVSKSVPRQKRWQCNRSSGSGTLLRFNSASSACSTSHGGHRTNAGASARGRIACNRCGSVTNCSNTGSGTNSAAILARCKSCPFRIAGNSAKKSLMIRMRDRDDSRLLELLMQEAHHQRRAPGLEQADCGRRLEMNQQSFGSHAVQPIKAGLFSTQKFHRRQLADDLP